MKWYAVELHTHTRHSDGRMTVAELLEQAGKNQLSLIALTDHNTMSGLREAGDRVIPGIEWTTYRGHMTVLGASRYVDWRDIDPEDLDAKLWEVRRAGGLCCVAHPFRIGGPICTGCHFDYPIRDPHLVDLWEVWSEELPFEKQVNEMSLAAWQARLDGGARTAAVYGRDWHIPESSGPVAVTCLGAEGELTVATALDALRRGCTAVSMGPIPILSVERGADRFHPGDELEPGPALVRVLVDLKARREVWLEYGLSVVEVRLIGTGGRVLSIQPFHPEGNEFPLYLEDGWVRAEIRGDVRGESHLLALTSAVFVRHSTMITAHAGAEGEVPNSVASIRRAIQIGCEALEVDVRELDGELVLSHDEAEGGARAATLSECFSLLEDAPRMRVNCDMKQPGLVGRAVSLARRHGIGTRLIFTGELDESDMLAFPERPDACWIVPCEEGTDLLDAASRAGCTHINLDRHEVTEELARDAAARRLGISAWTADDEPEIRRLLQLGVRNITTNRPLLAMSIRDAVERI